MYANFHGLYIYYTYVLDMIGSGLLSAVCLATTLFSALSHGSYVGPCYPSCSGSVALVASEVAGPHLSAVGAIVPYVGSPSAAVSPAAVATTFPVGVALAPAASPPVRGFLPASNLSAAPSPYLIYPEFVQLPAFTYASNLVTIDLSLPSLPLSPPTVDFFNDVVLLPAWAVTQLVNSTDDSPFLPGNFLPVANLTPTASVYYRSTFRMNLNLTGSVSAVIGADIVGTAPISDGSLEIAFSATFGSVVFAPVAQQVVPNPATFRSQLFARTYTDTLVSPVVTSFMSGPFAVSYFKNGLPSNLDAADSFSLDVSPGAGLLVTSVATDIPGLAPAKRVPLPFLSNCSLSCEFVSCPMSGMLVQIPTRPPGLLGSTTVEIVVTPL